MQWSAFQSVAPLLRNGLDQTAQSVGLSIVLYYLAIFVVIVVLCVFGVRAITAVTRRSRILWLACLIVTWLASLSVLFALYREPKLFTPVLQRPSSLREPSSPPVASVSSSVTPANSQPSSALPLSQHDAHSESVFEQAWTSLATLMSGTTNAMTVASSPALAPRSASLTWMLYSLATLLFIMSFLFLVLICTLRLRYGSYGAALRSVYRLFLWVFGCGMEQYLSLERAQYLDGVTSLRNEWDADTRLPPAAPNEPTPIIPVPIRLAGQCAIHTSLILKSEGLGSFGLDTPDNRRIAMLRAVDLMKARGVRESHIARSAPMAVALAFVPLPEEVAAAQIGVTQANLELLEAKSRQWIDPRVDGHLEPSMAHN